MIQISDYSPENPRFRALLDRSIDLPDGVAETVEAIIKDVRENGDKALFGYMEKFDGAELSSANVKVSMSEIEESEAHVSSKFKQALATACQNVRQYHEKQMVQPYTLDDGDGVVLKRRITPINRVGVTVPSGAAPLCSTFIMNAIPAQIAGVPEILTITAPRDGKVDSHILYTAKYLNLDQLYKISGAQGIAALAYGTESIPAVDKIVGPANIWGTTAKRLVFGRVGIDSMAGPSEIVVIADHTAKAAYIAADLISQAEHGTGDEAAIALVTDRALAQAVADKLDEFVNKYDLSVVEKAIAAFGNIFIVDSIDQAVKIVNTLAPEHVEIMTENAEDVSEKIINAGAIFIGEATPEPVGDYICGTNHVLPTNGTARFSSALGVADFLKATSIVNYSKKRLHETGPLIKELALAEGMRGHALSALVRIEDDPDI